MKLKHKYFFISCLYLLISLLNQSILFGQKYAIVVNGSHLYTEGSSNLNSNQTIYSKGDFLDRFDGANNGTIEANGSNIYVTGNWINESNYRVFTDFSLNNKDSYVTLNGNLTPQFIYGNIPTHFENLVLESSIKFLNSDSVEVNGTLYLNAPFHLNTNNLVLDNPLNTAINYISGFIKSETLPGNHGFVHWNIDNNTGLYSIPFGSDVNSFSNNLNLQINVISPMQSGDYISFATYPTDKYNYPLPDFTNALQHDITKVVDRFWIIKPSMQIGKPDINIYFSISPEDVNPAFNSINIDKLQAIRYNDINFSWTDIEPLGSSIGNITNTGLIEGKDFYNNWTLVQPPPPTANLYVPNGFSPDGDGINDEFQPVFNTDYIVDEYEFIIYDRYGNVVFQTTDKDEGWNGIVNGNIYYEEPVIGVYSWIILVKGRWIEDPDAVSFRKKYVGKVTLVN